MSASSSINCLYTTFATLTGHLYERKDARHTALIKYYLDIREQNIKGSTPLKTLFPMLPKHTKINLAKILLCTPFVELGFFGQPVSDTLLKTYTTSTQLNTLYPYSSKTSVNTLIKRASIYLEQNPHLTAFSVNNAAIKLGQLTQRLFDQIELSIPKERMPKASYHINLFKNCVLTTEIALPADLIRDVRLSLDYFNCYIPTCLFYSLIYQTTLGITLTPNIETMGFVLGYMGAKSARYSFIKNFTKDIGRKISDTYDIRYDRVGEIVTTADSPSHVFYVKDKKNASYDVRNIPDKDNPFRYVDIDGTASLMRSRGTYLVDHHATHYRKAFLLHQLQYHFPYEVRILTTRASTTRSLKNSSFTRDHHQLHAFCRLVGTNPVSKPPLDKRPTPTDNRWQPAFDAYMEGIQGTTPDMKKLALALLNDEQLYTKLQPKLKRLKKFLDKKRTSFFSADLTRVGVEDLPVPPQFADDTYRTLYRQAIMKWVKDPFALPNGTVTIKKLTPEGSKKARTTCRQHILTAISDAFHNRIWQVLFQSINKKMDYAVSNYLPGLAVPLYSMERIRDAVKKDDYALLNMDVKSCFDSLSLTHPNFLEALKTSLSAVEEQVSPAAANYLNSLFVNYLHHNFTHKKIKFKKSKSKKFKDIPMPEQGTLPTGFVLSPALWTTLALPAILKTHTQVVKHNLYAFDLCGDDLIAVAPRNLSNQTKEEICGPWFELANTLSLKFHFFKNYKENKLPFNSKWNYLFENRLEQNYLSAWIDRFPANSIPLYHAGTILQNKHHVETITSLYTYSMEGKLYSALSKRVRDKGANFIPWVAADKLYQHPVLVNRFREIAPCKRLKDQGAHKDVDIPNWLSSAQQCVMHFFFAPKKHDRQVIPKNYLYALDEGGYNNPARCKVSYIKQRLRYPKTSLCGIKNSASLLASLKETRKSSPPFYDGSTSSSSSLTKEDKLLHTERKKYVPLNPQTELGKERRDTSKLNKDMEPPFCHPPTQRVARGEEAHPGAIFFKETRSGGCFIL